jgi:hypothetical protein
MTAGSNPNGRAPALPVLPVADLQSAQPYLEAPFPPESIGFDVDKLNDSLARAFAFLSIEDVELRLTVVVGLENWRQERPDVLDAAHLTCRLTVFGITETDVGKGRDRRDQLANGIKRCARHFGVGRYLKPQYVRPVILQIGTGPDQVPLKRNGQPYLPERLLVKLRQGYERDIRRLAPEFGPPLIYPRQPWAAACTPPAHRNGATAAQNGTAGISYGERVRNLAAELGLNTAQLANAILTAAGEPARGPREASAVLEALLQRIPADVAERVLTTLTGQSTAARAEAMRLPARVPPAAVPSAAQDGGAVSVDFASLGPARDREAA